jgi:lambda family phage portal protein
MGFYKPEAGAGGPGALGDDKDGTDLVSEAEPGVFQILPKGFDFKDYDPKHPTANYRDFVKTQLREVAAGLRLSYNDFANDLEGVNFSSIRGGVLAERDSWMVQQAWWIEHLCKPVFAEWLQFALISGQLGNLPMTKYDKFHADSWLPRRWQWVDPLKDAEACKLMRAQGWKSDQQVVAEQGNDLDEVQEQILADEQAQQAIQQQADALTIDRIAAMDEKIGESGVEGLHWSHIATIGGTESAPGAYLDAAAGATKTAQEPAAPVDTTPEDEEDNP